jgi:predicted cation transporter
MEPSCLPPLFVPESSHNFKTNATGKLRIGSRTWARLGIPLGFAFMLFFFLVLQME